MDSVKEAYFSERRMSGEMNTNTSVRVSETSFRENLRQPKVAQLHGTSVIEENFYGE